MSYKVLLTHSAERDLEAIYDYIAENDTQANANYVLDKLMEVAESLAAFPERGSYPKELLALGIREYRQAHLSGQWQTSDHLHHCRWAARHADPTDAQNAWCIALGIAPKQLAV